MKEIKAYVKRERFDAVAHELRHVEGLTVMSAALVAHGFSPAGDNLATSNQPRDFRLFAGSRPS